MRLLALLLVPAFIGLVTSQQAFGQGHNSPDMGTHPGGGSHAQQADYPVYPNLHGQQVPQMNNVHHQAVGAPPIRGSSGQQVPDYLPVADPGPINSNVNHIGAGTAPVGGSSQGTVFPPEAPVQTGMRNKVDMFNIGQAPIGGNQNSNEFVDYGVGMQGGANNAPAAAGHGGRSGGNNQVANNAHGGSSGSGGPAFGAAPLGGAVMNDLTQQEAGKAEHVSGAASVGGTVVGVVVAVLVLVGIVGVAAIFLVRQRQSRMTLASV